MFDKLGDRYNRAFNVETTCSMELSLFLHDQQAVDLLNSKKRNLLNAIDDLKKKGNGNNNYLDALTCSVSKLPNLTSETLFCSFAWEDIILSDIEPFIKKFREIKADLIKKRDESHLRVLDRETLEYGSDGAVKDIREIEIDLAEIDTLINLPNIISITDRERKLLCSKVMALYGEAGAGKSQLLAYKTKELLDQDNAALLLVAGIYYSELPIHDQIMSNLRLGCSFDELIDILEAIGERDNCIVPLFIDALNETWHKSLWKTGLPAIIDKIEKTSMVKLVLSYRTEYESLLFSDAIQEKKQNETIVSIYHRVLKIIVVMPLGSF